MLSSSSLRSALNRKVPGTGLRNARPPRVRMLRPVRFIKESASDFAPETRGMTIDELIHQDHEKVRSLFDEYSKATAPETKQQLAYNIIRELSVHSSKEEDTVYPLFAKVFGSSAGQHLLDEHHFLKQKLEKLSSMDAINDTDNFDKQVASVKTEFDTHSKEEEERDMPKLVQRLGVEDAKELGVQFQKATAHAVTRPHPDAPDKPPLSSIAKAAAAPLDAAADAIRFKGQKPEDTIPPKEQS